MAAGRRSAKIFGSRWEKFRWMWSFFGPQPRPSRISVVIVRDQVEGKILDEKLDRVPHRLAVEGMQHRMARAVGDRAGAQRGRARAVESGHAAERALIDLSVGRAVERHAVLLELEHGR